MFLWHKTVTANLIKSWIYVVSKLDFSNWCCTSGCQANAKANNALLTQRGVENPLISFKQQRNKFATSTTRSCYPIEKLTQATATDKAMHFYFSHLFSLFSTSLLHCLSSPVKKSRKNCNYNMIHNTAIEHWSFYHIFVAIQQCSGRHHQMQHLLQTQLEHQRAICACTINQSISQLYFMHVWSSICVRLHTMKQTSATVHEVFVITCIP